ncbi:MAG TPA: DUF523 domain-containing protein [Kofleriaceae bacterium]|nr:DUF523 domain-containing protein [Kofleriaceae bacterium]
MTRPRVGVSACLLGEEVRHDGRHKRSRAVVELVGPEVDWVAVCPEVEVGMPVPREPVVLTGEGPRMVGAATGTDHTDAMLRFAEARIAAFAPLDGYVLKSRSPSCGLTGVPGAPGGSGLYAATLRRLCPDLPLAEETALEDDDRRRAFLAAVHAHRRARQTSSRP